MLEWKKIVAGGVCFDYDFDSCGEKYLPRSHQTGAQALEPAGQSVVCERNCVYNTQSSRHTASERAARRPASNWKLSAKIGECQSEVRTARLFLLFFCILYQCIYSDGRDLNITYAHTVGVIDVGIGVDLTLSQPQNLEVGVT
jgi:hypothetical protein